MRQEGGPISSGGRLLWLDTTRGVAILWIVYFHFFQGIHADYPWPVTLSDLERFLTEAASGWVPAQILYFLGGLPAAVIQQGSDSVGAFILLSGFGLTYSLALKAKEPVWPSWYRRRLLRLFPVYWIAHLICLVSPLTRLNDPIDYRFILSFLGDRVYPIDTMFFYLAPAWWFFGLLLQFYVAFPLLYRTLKRLGPARFAAVCALLAIVARYLLFIVFDVNGNWLMGGFFVCRLWEFSAGMVLGTLLATRKEQTLRWLFSLPGFLAGAVCYYLALLTIEPTPVFIFCDGLNGIGLFILLAHVGYQVHKLPAAGKLLAMTGVYSYGIYLIHQPFVIYAGELLRGAGMGVFLTLGSAIVATVAAGAMAVEWTANKAMGRIGGR